MKFFLQIYPNFINYLTKICLNIFPYFIALLGIKIGKSLWATWFFLRIVNFTILNYAEGIIRNGGILGKEKENLYSGNFSETATRDVNFRRKLPRP